MVGGAFAGVVGMAGLWAIRSAVARIEANPDPYPREGLAREPEGEEVPQIAPPHAATHSAWPPVSAARD